MTTASVYYHLGEPHFVLINGESANVDTPVNCDPHGQAQPAQFPWKPPAGAHLSAVDAACRTLGWKVVDPAPIVRQADGRGTVRVEPTAELLAAADRATDSANERTAAELAAETTAYVTVDDGGLGHVAVDGRAQLLPAGLRPQPTPMHRMMIDMSSLNAVDAALGLMGYKRMGAVHFHDAARTWQVRAERVAADWRDVPTLVRINDDAAEALNDMSAKLGIPAEQLASEWIAERARSALYKYNRDMAPGYFLDHSRIGGFLPDGSAYLKDNDDANA